MSAEALQAHADALTADVRDGLWADPPSLPPRWFYDERGSRLFDEITRLPEYYPTRRETEILHARSDEIVSGAALAGTGESTVVELGAGMSTKTRILLDAFVRAGRRVRFVPLDVSAEVLHESADALREEYPGMTVEPAVADFHDELGMVDAAPGERLAIFLGGTVGNFEEEERRGFLQRVRASLAPGDHFLLGADLVKDEARLVAAYDDAAGVTADFNLNLLDVLRDRLDVAGLDRQDFVHEATWNAADSRIEMRLRAVRDVTATFPTLDRVWRLGEGEALLTEVSRKFDLSRLADEVAGLGLEPQHSWTDDGGDYALLLTRAD